MARAFDLVHRDIVALLLADHSHVALLHVDRHDEVQLRQDPAHGHGGPVRVRDGVLEANGRVSPKVSVGEVQRPLR